MRTGEGRKSTLPESLSVAARAVLLFSLAITCAGCLGAYEPPKLSPPLDHAQVLMGEKAYEKCLFRSVPQVGEISQLLAGWPADREGAALVVVSNQGARFLGRDGAWKRTIEFPSNQHGQLRVVPLDRGGAYGFLTRDPTMISGLVLYDRDGKELWRYSSFWGIDDSVAGFLNGASAPAFVVGLNGFGGIRLLDQKGNEIWRQSEGNVWHVEIVDPAGDGNGKILNSNASGQLTVRDDSGAVKTHFTTLGYVSNFTLVRWGQEPRAVHLLIPPTRSTSGSSSGKPQFRILDPEGRQVAQLDAPLGDLLVSIAGTSVAFKRGLSSFAVLQDFKPMQRSLLFLYDEEGRLVYQETIANACRGINALPGDSGESLLIGCSDKIWEYKLAADAAASKPAKK
jgi:hypothetical protein